ncbi:MAG: glycosyltransferase [Candidatus Magasanikbacteria bacterium]|nr:glycosyltransferase [Candidatus Magasanikbacteria bacterium]
MKIVQVHKYYWHRDGASNYSLYLTELLEKAGHTVIPFSVENEKNFKTPYSKYFVSNMELGDPSKVSFLDKIKGIVRIFYSFEARRKMKQLIKDEEPDLIHLHNIYHHISPSILGVIKKHKIPVVMTLHDYKLLVPNYSMFHHGAVHEEDAKGFYLSCIKNRCQKNSLSQSIILTLEMIFHHKIMRYYKRYVDKFIAPSKFMKKKCIEFGWKKEKFVNLPNPIDVERFNLSKTDRGYIAFVGRVSEEKGVGFLIDTAIKNTEIDIKIIGDGPQLEILQNAVEQEGLRNVEFTGFQTGKKLERLIGGARILVTPSIWYENYPLSVLEAKAMGKIVLASNIGGLPEMVSNSMLFEPRNSEEMALKIKYWFNKKEEELLDVGQELRKEVLKINSPEKHLKQILALYKEVKSL